MKKSIFIVMAMATLFTVACKKNKTENPPPPDASPAEGYWAGKYTTLGILGSENAAVLINPAGTMRYYELGTKTDTVSLSPNAKVTGVWVLNGSTFQASYETASKTVNLTLTMNAAKTQMNGTWGFNATTKGNMELKK